jgi:hypothetical protein
MNLFRIRLSLPSRTQEEVNWGAEWRIYLPLGDTPGSSPVSFREFLPCDLFNSPEEVCIWWLLYFLSHLKGTHSNFRKSRGLKVT